MRMSARGNAPKLVTWIVCLVLFVVAVAGHFGVIQPGPVVMTWSWILGFGLLLIACRFRGL
jgi:ABC-type multidrug transport system permease subunit